MESLAVRSRRRRRLQRRHRRACVPIHVLLDEPPRAGFLQDRQDGGYVALAQGAAQPLARRGIGRVPLERMNDWQRSLALEDVAADRLAGQRRLAPDAEKVVARLEGEPKLKAELRQAS